MSSLSIQPHQGLPNFANETGVPNVGPGFGTKPFVDKAKPPYLINEYGWLWINRDGSLPTLTTRSTGRSSARTPRLRNGGKYYARTLAAKTEFRRSHRKCAGVLHFCGLWLFPARRPEPAIISST